MSEPETTTVVYRVQSRLTVPGLDPFPWETSPVGWLDKDHGCHALANARCGLYPPGTEFRLVKITTEVCE